MIRYSEEFIDGLITRWGKHLPNKEELKAGLREAERAYDDEMEHLEWTRQKVKPMYEEERKALAAIERRVQALMVEIAVLSPHCYGVLGQVLGMTKIAGPPPAGPPLGADDDPERSHIIAMVADELLSEILGDNPEEYLAAMGRELDLLLSAVQTTQKVLVVWWAKGGGSAEDNRDPVRAFLHQLRKVWRGPFKTMVVPKEGKLRFTKPAGEFAFACVKPLKLPNIRHDDLLMGIVDREIRRSK